MAFTLVFEGDIRELTKNPHKTDSPWGRPIASGVGNVFDELDEARRELMSELGIQKNAPR